MAAKRDKTLPTVGATEARRLLLAGQGLLADPSRRATPAAIYKQIEAMGFVQVDTINIVDRAHHHILRTRFDDYQPKMLDKLLEKDRRLFEHWTHDASVIPSAWLDCWLVRFARYRARGHSPNSWWAQRMGGKGEAIIAAVRERIEREGPLMSKDFEHPEGSNGPWWGWKPQKAALEYLWRIGELGVSARINFHKRYDLMERVFPQIGEMEAQDEAAHLDWACTEALDRLAVATPTELAQFFDAVTNAEAVGWCKQAVKDGAAIEVLIESANGDKSRKGFALPDWKRRAKRCRPAPDRMRLLSPFDPVVRDRKRLARLFDFDYRFEGFTPAAKRRYGYYVLPILEGERLVGRLDPKLHRDRGVLEIKDLWWEQGVKATKMRRSRLDEALQRLAASLGADRVEMNSGAAR